MTYLFFICGFAFLIKGAQLLVDGATGLARKLKMSELAIGLTVVAFGTSAPELTINLISNFKNTTDLAVGNVLGASITNILLIAGLAALIYPVKIKVKTIGQKIGFALLPACVLFFIVLNPPHVISRFFAVLLLFIFFWFLYHVFGSSHKSGLTHVFERQQHNWTMIIVYILVGTAGLVIGSNWVIGGAVAMAQFAGISQAVIGLTVVSLGTTMPELVASLVASWKKESELAIGNIIGSSVVNMTFILGLSAMFRPIQLEPFLINPLVWVLASILLLYYFIFSGRRKGVIEHWEGVGLICAYLIFIFFLVWRS